MREEYAVSARVYLRYYVRICTCNRLANSETSTEELMGERERGGEGEVVVSRGWTAYLLGTISLSGGNAHACMYACMHATHAILGGLADLDLTFDPPPSFAITCTTGVPLYCRLQRGGEEMREFARHIYLRTIEIIDTRLCVEGG